MQTLGISDKPQKPDNWFQRICWPSDSPQEVDDLSRRGFWICALVAAFSCVVLLIQGHWMLAPFILLVYLLGGIGVREHSFPAAILIAVIYFADMASTLLVAHKPPGALGIVFLLVLLGNIRGTWIAAKWSKQPLEGEELYRLETTWRDKLVDQMPAKVWPIGKVVFYFLGGAYLALIAWIVIFWTMRRGA
jgi:hypothetical protein